AISPSNASQKVTWSSNNSSVVKFDDKESGVVTGNISGTAEVTALTKDGSNKSGKTTIRTKRIVQSFVLEPKEVDKNTPVVLDSQGRVLLTSGCSVRLVPKFTPTDVTDEGLKWEMNPKNCLEIDADKKIVTAKDVKSETKVTVKATSLDGGEASYEMEFVIIPKVESIEIYDTRDMKTPVNGKAIGVNPEVDSKPFTLRVKNKPDYASQVVLWKSSNAKVVTVTDHEDGSCTVTVSGYGKAVITATAADGSGVTASVTVNVSSLVSSITITGNNKVAIGGKIKLKVEVFPKSAENKAVIWESDDISIATVNKNTGEVTGINKGLADITATAADGGGASKTFHILVTEAVKTFDLMIPDGNTDLEDDVIGTNKVVGIDLDAGMETYTMAARILPEEASHAVEWKSSNEKIATVDEKGTITAKSLGKAIITATTTDGSNKTAKTTVNVATLARNVSITGSHYVSAGQSIQLHAEVTEKDAANKSVIWTSSDKNAVVVDDSGLVTAVSRTGEAMAKITAEAADGSGKYAEHIVYVMGKSDKIQITEFDGRFVDSSKKSSEIDIQDIKNTSRRVSFVAELDGGSTQQGDYRKEVEWKTSNKSIADVYSVQNKYGSSEAEIRILKEGTVTITARTTDGSNREDSYTLKVIDTDPDVTIIGPRQVANGKKIQLSTEGSVAVTWESLDPSVATVDAKGKVTAKKNKSEMVTIRAISTKGTQKMADYYVEVGPAVTGVDILVNGESVKSKKLGIDLIKGYTMDDGKTWNNKLTLYASVQGANYDDRVTWKSNKTAVAAVDENGNVEIKKNGTAVITATATDGSGKSAKVTLLVTKQITKIEPEDGVQDIYVGYKKSVQLKLAYKPLAATTKKVTWESDDKSLVSVTSSGKITVKKPFGSGDYDTSSDNSVIIRAKAADGSTAFCEFRVHFVAPATKVQIVEREDNADKEYASVVGIDIDTNDAKTRLKANVMSTNSYADQYSISQKVTWKSSNTSVAEVETNDDGSCTVTGHKNGTVTITATAADGSKKSGKVTVYVGKLITSIETTKDIQGVKDDEGREIITLYVKSIANKKTLQLSDKLVVNPITATNKKLTYKSNNSKLVSVSSSGKLTAKKRGEDVIITITTNDGSGVKKEIRVRVLQ
ncbi:MAG: Ig-like domain-containing protein, partial [Lachnospiraceae bacterium]|nr:Ig-like domain-containing protein [Lachnospiraceae bacterium]